MMDVSLAALACCFQTVHPLADLHEHQRSVPIAPEMRPGSHARFSEAVLAYTLLGTNV
jgi:hypothetical protein